MRTAETLVRRLQKVVQNLFRKSFQCSREAVKSGAKTVRENGWLTVGQRLHLCSALCDMQFADRQGRTPRLQSRVYNN